jgi:hypothetical protein
LESILKGSGLFAGFSPQSSPSESRQFFTQDDAEIDEAVSRLLEAGLLNSHIAAWLL